MRLISALNKLLTTILVLVTGSNCVAQLNPMVVGTMRPGDSVVIYYDVTINSGLPASVFKIANQGAVTESAINMVTDDPDTPLANDSTFSFLISTPLPVTLTELRAVARTSTVDLTWNTSFEVSMVKYEVEKSVDGRTFSKIGEVRSLNSLLPGSYSFVDASPNIGVNFYRLRLIDQLNSPKYSSIVRVDMDGKNSIIKVYPNPPVDRTVTLQLSNMQKGNYELMLYSSMGQLVHKIRINHAGGSANKNIVLPTSLPKGVYTLIFIDEYSTYQHRLILK